MLFIGSYIFPQAYLLKVKEGFKKDINIWSCKKEM